VAKTNTPARQAASGPPAQQQAPAPEPQQTIRDVLKRHVAVVYLPTVIPDRPIRFVVGDVEGFLMSLKKEY
jgi:hypothetical protein